VQVGPTHRRVSKGDAVSFATELLEFDSVDSVKVFDPSDKLIGGVLPQLKARARLCAYL
jgi:hypothetical protein